MAADAAIIQGQQNNNFDGNKPLPACR